MKNVVIQLVCDFAEIGECIVSPLYCLFVPGFRTDLNAIELAADGTTTLESLLVIDYAK